MWVFWNTFLVTQPELHFLALAALPDLLKAHPSASLNPTEIWWMTSTNTADQKRKERLLKTVSGTRWDRYTPLDFSCGTRPQMLGTTCKANLRRRWEVEKSRWARASGPEERAHSECPGFPSYLPCPGIFVHGWWGCRREQSPCKTVFPLPTGLNRELPLGPHSTLRCTSKVIGNGRSNTYTRCECPQQTVCSSQEVEITQVSMED